MRQQGSPPPKKVQPPQAITAAAFLVLGWVAREVACVAFRKLSGVVL